MFTNREVNFSEIAVTLNTSIKGGYALVAVVQNQQHVYDSERWLKLFRRHAKDLLHRHITMEASEYYHYMPELNRQSAERTTPVNHSQSGQNRNICTRILVSQFCLSLKKWLPERDLNEEVIAETNAYFFWAQKKPVLEEKY